MTGHHIKFIVGFSRILSFSVVTMDNSKALEMTSKLTLWQCAHCDLHNYSKNNNYEIEDSKVVKIKK